MTDNFQGKSGSINSLFIEYVSKNGVGGTLFNFPRGFESFRTRSKVSCGEIVLVRKDIRETIEGFRQWKFLGSAEPGPLEQLVIYLNPKQNKRRSRIEFYSNPSCS